MSDRALATTRIGIFGKGGAGKSTVTAFFAQALRRSAAALVAAMEALHCDAAVPTP